ncbi:MAG: PAS domain S-box protein [Elusimicrobiales bacterium]|nr:PAS domain S-box protein [Elusimicrobiales bacterium]
MPDTLFSAEILNLRKRLAGIFAAAAVCILAGGLAYHHHYQKAIQRDAADLLSAIKRFKTDQILFWRADRYNDTNSLLDTPVLSRFLNSFAADTSDAALREQLRARLTSYLRHNKYRSALLARPDGRVAAAAGENTAELPPEAKALILKAIASGKTEIGDFYLGPSGRPRMDVVSRAATAPGGKALYLVLELAPDDYLYPLLQTWPTNSRTGETVLARKDGRDLLFLGDLRKTSNAGMKLRLPLAGSSLPIARALNGEEGIISGEDYHGDRVMAAVGLIPGTNWGIVVKADWDEIMAASGRLSALVLLFTLFLVVTAGGWAYLLFRVQTAKYEREIDKAAAGLRESELIFESFMKYSPVYVFFKDKDIRSLRLSHNYETMLGRPLKELLGKTMDDLFPSELARSMIADDKRILQEGKQVVVEEAFNGRSYRTIKFPVEIDGKKNYLAGYTIDITEQKQASEKIEAIAREWETTFNSIDDVVWMLDAEHRVVRANAATDRLFPGKSAKVIGRHCWEIVHGTSGPIAECPVERSRRSLARETMEYALLGKIFEVVVDPVIGPDGKYAGAVHILRDITERKQAQLELEKAQKDLVKNLRLYTLLARINQAAAQTKDIKRLYQNLCEVAVESGGFKLAWVGYPDRDTGRVLPICSAGAPEGYLDHIKISAKEGPTSRGPAGTAVRTGRVSACQDIETDPDMQPWREAALKRGFRSAAAVPLYEGTSLTALLVLYSGEKGFFTEDEVKLLAAVKDDVSLAIESISTGEKHGSAQSALERTTTQLTHMMEAAPVVIFTLRLINDRLIPQWVSGNSEVVIGHEPAEMLSPEWFAAVIHPDDKAWVLGEIAQVFKKGLITHDFRMARKDGSYTWVHAQLRPNPETPGEITGSWTDITPLKESELRFRKLFEKAPLACRPPEQAGRDEIYLAEPGTGRLTFASAGALKALGYTRPEIEQKFVFDIVRDLNAETFRAVITPLVRKQKPLLIIEIEHLRKDGSSYPVQSRVQLLEGAAGAMLLIVSTELREGAPK